MKKVIYIMLAAILLVGLGLSCAEEPAPAPPAPAPTPPAPAPPPAPPAPEPVTIKLLSFLPKTHAMTTPVHMMTKKIEKASDGLITFDWPGGPEVIPTFDQPEALRTGVIDANFYMPGMYMSGFMPEVFAAALSPYPAWEEREVGIYDLMAEVVAKKANCKYLGRLESLLSGFHFYTTERPIKKVEDFKGLTFRVAALYIPIIEKLGAAGVTLDPQEVVPALSRGVVNGMVNAEIGTHAGGYDEFCKYMIEPGFGQLDNYCLINMDAWNKIPANLQGVIVDSIKDGEYMCTAEMIYRVQDDWEACKQSGMELMTMEPDEATKLLDIVYSTLWDNVLEKAPEYGPKFKELMTR